MAEQACCATSAIVADSQEIEEYRVRYDFSQAERGKFYHPDAVCSYPVYLEPDVSAFLDRLAEQKKVDVQDLVNDLLRKDIQLIQSVQ